MPFLFCRNPPFSPIFSTECLIRPRSIFLGQPSSTPCDIDSNTLLLNHWLTFLENSEVGRLQVKPRCLCMSVSDCNTIFLLHFLSHIVDIPNLFSIPTLVKGIRFVPQASLSPQGIPLVRFFLTAEYYRYKVRNKIHSYILYNTIIHPTTTLLIPLFSTFSGPSPTLAMRQVLLNNSHPFVYNR